MDSPRKATNYPRRAATPAASDKHLWARSYERELRDVLLLQSEVARAIADEIQVKITPQERLRLTTTQPRQLCRAKKQSDIWHWRWDLLC